MTSLCAIIPVAQMLAANTTLETAGFGPNNFSVPCYAGPGATHGALHSWDIPAFASAVKAIAGVAWEESDGDPVTRTNALIEAQGAKWGDQAPALPTTGNAVANTLYKYTDDTLWWCIQTFSRSTYPAHPSTYPALIRQARVPGTVEPWKQPLDQWDAYKLVNAFTGQGDRCTYQGQTWVVTQADGAGNNIYPPGVYGWTVVS